MENKEKLIRSLLAGAEHGHVDVRVAALTGIGESGLIDEDRLVAALKNNADGGSHVKVVSAALAAMGRMLRDSDRQ